MRALALVALVLVPAAAAGISDSMFYTLRYEETGRVTGGGTSTYAEAETTFHTSLEMTYTLVGEYMLLPSGTGAWAGASLGEIQLTADGTYTQEQDGIAGHEEGTCTLDTDTTVPSSATMAKTEGKLVVTTGENAHLSADWSCDAAYAASRPFVGGSIALAQRAGSLPGPVAAALGYAYDAKTWEAWSAEERLDSVLDDGGVEVEDLAEQQIPFQHSLDPATAPGDDVCSGVMSREAAPGGVTCEISGTVKVSLHPADLDGAPSALADEGAPAKTPGGGIVAALVAVCLAVALRRR